MPGVIPGINEGQSVYENKIAANSNCIIFVFFATQCTDCSDF